MAFLLNQIFSLFKLLNSETGTVQIALGLTAGLILGFAPAFSPQALLVLIAIFIFRIQIGAALIAAFFFAFIAWLIDPLAHALGGAVLEIEALAPLFTLLYNLPLVPYTGFNNSITMGSALLTIALAPLVFIGSKKLIIKYRATVREALYESKFWKFWKGTTLYNLYIKYSTIRGKL